MATTDNGKRFPEKFITRPGDAYWEGEDFGVKVTPKKAPTTKKSTPAKKSAPAKK